MCSSGRYNDQKGQAACKFCAVGLYSDQFGQAAAPACKACEAGRHTDQPGSRECKNKEDQQCSVGQFVRSGAPTPSGIECAPCPTGMYNDMMIKKLGYSELTRVRHR